MYIYWFKLFKKRMQADLQANIIKDNWWYILDDIFISPENVEVFKTKNGFFGIKILYNMEE